MRSLHLQGDVYTPVQKDLTSETSRKVFASLVENVYSKLSFALLASLLCGTLLTVGLYEPAPSKSTLLYWYTFFLAANLPRALLSLAFKRDLKREQRPAFWRNIYVLGSLFGGISWGLTGIVLFPYVGPMEQTMIMFTLGGITAANVLLSSSVPAASMMFLIASLVPFIYSVTYHVHSTFLEFDATLIIYLAYTFFVTMKMYSTIKQSIVLRYANDQLLSDVAETKYQLEIINRRLEKAATHDALTGLPNRMFFHSQLEKVIHRARQHDKMIALFYIDLDNFKPVNDAYGHQTGDTILKVLAARLGQMFGSSENIARIGGDELTAIIENATSINEIERHARRVCHTIASPIQVGDQTIMMSASVGIAIYPEDGEDIDSLITTADKYMYMVKNNGGNSYYYQGFDVMA